MKFAETELKQITEETWRIVLGEELVSSTQPLLVSQMMDPMAACAQIVGDWHLGAVLYCPLFLARHAAGRMFEMPADQASNDDIQDTLCELINIIAGNVKGVLSGSNHLSLPNVVNGSNFRLRFPRHVLLSEASFLYQEQPLVVRLLGEDRASSLASAAAAAS